MSRWKFIIFALLLVVSPESAIAAMSLSQYGITWTFNADYQTGQFVNGDYWVVDPGAGVQITNISPGFIDTPRHKNGSMINPAGNQGYDGAGSYTQSENVGIGISPGTPLVLSAGQSLVSSISNDTPLSPNVYTGWLNTAAVLTCLASAPPANSFRPGYSDPEKTIYNYSQVDTSKLKNLYTSAPINYTTFAGYFQRPWLVHMFGDTDSRFLLPNSNVPDNYYYTGYINSAMLGLHAEATIAEKQALLINFIQLGIDFYGVIKSGQQGWYSQAGYNYGKKMPILFAGAMLNDTKMLSIGSKSGDYYSGSGAPPSDYLQFGEDKQTRYITQEWVDCTNGVGCTWVPDNRGGESSPYTTSMIGMPEWLQYGTAPNKGDASWHAIYRRIYSVGPSFAGTALAAHIMGVKSAWNHNAFFDYTDRYVAITTGNVDPFGFTVPYETSGYSPSGIAFDMWTRYRADYIYPTARRLFRNVRLGEVEP